MPDKNSSRWTDPQEPSADTLHSVPSYSPVNRRLPSPVWNSVVEMLSKFPQPLAHTDQWLRLIRQLLDMKLDLRDLPADGEHFRSVLEATHDWTSYSVVASDFAGEDPTKVKLVLPLLKPVQLALNVAHEMFDMYVNSYSNLLFEPSLYRYNPATKQKERYYSHPTTSDWFADMHALVRTKFPTEKVRLLVAHFYSDSTLAADGSHHPVYLQLANSTLAHYQSPLGKRCIGLLPSIPECADLSDTAIAQLRTRLFHVVVGKLVSSLREAFLTVFTLFLSLLSLFSLSFCACAHSLSFSLSLLLTFLFRVHTYRTHRQASGNVLYLSLVAGSAT